ncbi:ubiquitin carboxyl-terminal hydrolase 28 isoform X2 [Erpetoichthys calabaricus]|uniref:ubiquitin carboxyl-terminal hydrolase 28 isoform X2 n=1 Tax=Erpetoichthys calabaricus TaxID=27687 RepID=UPI0022344374|nr:ubiquitin carboxyl-terminal hydrolase 28 isoform X2 [Erpetoichthys calabaricus]
MTAELQCENEESAEKTQQFLINQLREITGTQDIRILQKTLKASNWDVSQAISLLTAQEPETEVTAVEPSATEGSAVGRDVEKNSNDVTHNDNDDLQAAIQLSLQESCCAQVEERDLNRALEASVAESKACVKRKRCEAWGDNSLNPTDWIRQNDWPVGMKNVGNTCWFSAVIQSLFHLPQFRKLVLNYSVPQSILENCKNQRVKRNIAFMQELRCLFALMVGTNRKFVDPSAAVELLKDAFRTTEAQQDVSEFTHKLLDWLEDAFQLTADGNNPAGKQENPMVQLFYGTFLAERIHNGKTLSNIERFGQYPLQVNGFDSLHECLEGAMVEGEIEALHSDQTIHSSQERWFSKLPPVLTFELSRFEFNQSLGRPEKIHKKLEFPQVIYMDRYLHKNMELTHTKRKEVKTLKEQMIFLQKRLESYLSYGSGPTKYPLADMLQYVLEFASTQPTNLPPTQNIRIAAPPQNETITLATETPLELTSLAETETLTSQVDNQVTSPACQRIPGFKPFTHCNTTTDAPPYPAPHSVTEEELIFIKSCLQRWRREVEQNIQELKDNIETIKNTLENIYSDDQFCQVPYRLHAILVHEGQASAGHYWAYIFDHEAKRWLKYNDISVTESSWDELERDSFGGMKNASAYCLMYIDDNLPNLIAEETDVETGQVLKGLDSLPAVLRRYVWEDNHWFQQEVEEWNEEQFRKVPQKEHPVSMTAESQETTQSVNTSEDLTVQQTHRSLSEEHAGISKEQTAQAIANTAECYEKNGVEAALTEQSESESKNSSGEAGMTSDSLSETTEIQEQSSKTDERPAESQVSEVEIPNVGKILVRSDGDGYNEEAFHEEYSRLYLLAQEHATPQNDPRLQHVLVYLFQNNAPKRIIERTLLEQFADRNLSYDERSISIMKEARAKLRLIGPEDMDMDEYRKWHEDYSLFRKVFVYLLTGLEQYQNGKISEAVTYLVYAYQNNTTLLMNGSTRGVEEKLIALYRRRCLKELNENAARLFDCGEETDVAECMRIMNDIVIPCMHLMITNDICKEDLDAIETLRNRWCSYLGQDIDAALQEKLGEFLPRLLDCSAEIIVLKEPPKIRPHSSHDLCSRFAAVMESIHGVTPVTVK